jgi:hypothetical protein
MKRRKPRPRPRPRPRPLDPNALDGLKLATRACCQLDIEVRAGGTVTVQHDDGCAALDPEHPGHAVSRAVAAIAVAEALRRHTGGPQPVVVI